MEGSFWGISTNAVNDSTEVSDLSKKIMDMEKASKNLGMDKRDELNILNQRVVEAVQKLAKDESRKALEKSLEKQRKSGEPMNPALAESLSKDIQEHTSAMHSLQSRGQVTASDQDFLKSLYFSGIKAIHHKIDRAHSTTFQWIFDSSKNSEIRFNDWLRGDSGIFFVHGKPGSGKSTLMKYIFHAPETREQLKEWAGEKKLVMAQYFFWNAGSTLQKSQEGLLRSLLFEILCKCRDFIPLVKQSIGDIEDFESDEDRWSKDQLLRTYRVLVDTDLSTRFCFFIDGLDEYYDSNRKPEELIHTLRSIQATRDIKLCVSSRPWPAFMDSFTKTEWVLKVEDLTSDDIIQYVTDKFNEEEQYRELSKANSEYADVVQQVATHAKGVFLWVILVVRNLVEGFRNKDAVRLIRDRLEKFPKDLQKFFEHMLNSIPDIYRKLTARTFQTAASSQRPLLLLLYSFLDEMEADTNSLHQLIRKPFNLSEIQSRQDQMRRQLYGRSQGLLEVVSDEDETKPFFQLRVDFLHRTVRDFLLDLTSGDDIFEQSLKGESRNTPLLVCHAIVAQMKLGMTQKGLREDEMLQFLEDLFFFAHLAVRDHLREAPFSAIEGLLDTAGATYTEARFKYKWAMRDSDNMLLGLAAQYDFHSYMSRKLKNPATQSMLNRGAGRPVLDYALVPASGSGVVQYSKTMVELLLKSGAKPNRPYKNSTIWLRFVHALAERQVEADRILIATIVKVLVDYKSSLEKTTLESLHEVLSSDELAIAGLEKTPFWKRLRKGLLQKH